MLMMTRPVRTRLCGQEEIFARQVVHPSRETIRYLLGENDERWR